jgi:hypothetical protein
MFLYPAYQHSICSCIIYKILNSVSVGNSNSRKFSFKFPLVLGSGVTTHVRNIQKLLMLQHEIIERETHVNTIRYEYIHSLVSPLPTHPARWKTKQFRA